MKNTKEGTVPKFGPLQGLKVLDIGTLVAGPFGASILADFGAEVIKVEQPKNGDTIRQAGKSTKNGGSMGWITAARNKRSITLDLRQSEGQSLLKRLVKWADILIENFSPKTLESWNLGYDELSAINPRLIMVRVSGYGQSGPYSHKPGLDRLALGFSGLKYVTGYPDQPPVRVGVTIADYLTGTFNALSALMAVYYRDVIGTGKGQEIDLALYEAPLRISEDIVTTYDQTGEVRGRYGNRHPSFAPAEIFETADERWVVIQASLDKIFASLANVMGQPNLAHDPRFSTLRKRSENADEIHRIIREWVKEKTAEEVTSLLEKADVPVGPVNNIADIFRDSHIAARENITKIEDPDLGKVATPGIVPKFSETPGKVWRLGPTLGADNDEIYLGILNLEKEEYESLKKKYII
ncbi:CaiB/BaiF CoA transferase family protein [Bacillus dakarensis]|uniref:CaiB/BaiF CoA transferase family protein n=1 Tax=Robertmurraya dakarensis TaxID=1926278 RepID=UPI00098162FC|nr:CoA transferase [Bacillus dakarensis]